MGNYPWILYSSVDLVRNAEARAYLMPRAAPTPLAQCLANAIFFQGSPNQCQDPCHGHATEDDERVDANPKLVT